MSLLQIGLIAFSGFFMAFFFGYLFAKFIDEPICILFFLLAIVFFGYGTFFTIHGKTSFYENKDIVPKCLSVNLETYYMLKDGENFNCLESIDTYVERGE